jgi:ribosomal protein S18 acetylase RimI-like enzyme
MRRRKAVAARPSAVVQGLRMRDARPEDRRAIFQFTRQTWGNYGDFIPRVWRSWINDPSGRFIVAELGGVAIGTAKITDFGSGEVWLQGLRVDPRYRGKGIARAINVEVARTLGRMKARAVRYSTGRTNWASRHIGGSFGFRIAVRLRYYWQKSRAGRIRGRFASKRDAAAVYQFMRGSKFIRLTSGLVAEGWLFRELTPGLVASYIRRRQVMVVERSGKLVGVAAYTPEKADRSLCMGFVDGDPAAIAALTRNCLYLARARGDKECSVAVPSRGFPRLVEAGGLSRKDSMGQIVLEYVGPGRLVRRGRKG